MKAHILQHVPFEGVGSMTDWLNKSRADVTYTRFFESAHLPPVEGLDLVIVMGGPMSVNDEEVLPWLRSEKEFIGNAINAGISVLGVCLGAQLIASTLKADVYRNPQKEIGWFPVEAETRVKDVFIFPKEFFAFHWHGETFDLPKGAISLARSKACENQAFQIGKNVIGLQFHLEVTHKTIEALLENCGSELKPGPYIQTEAELRGVNNSMYTTINSMMVNVLTYLTRDKV